MTYKPMARFLILWAIMGMMYLAIEAIWRIPSGGYANVAMIPVGGLCGVAVGAINQIKPFYRLKVIAQSLIGASVILAVEYISGLILNVWLCLGIWDYSQMPLNLSGQICLLYGILWFFLCPFAIWTEDYIRWALWRENEPYSVAQVYKEFITLK